MAEQLQTDHPPTEDEAPLTKIITGIVNDAQNLIKQQLALFQVELREDLRNTRNAIIPLLIGIGVGMLGLFFLFVTIGLLLSELAGWPYWAGFALVTGVMLILGVALVLVGVNKFRSFNPLPDKTVEALKENVQWLTKR
jgi:uncharacterized membrane protein YqjE